MNFTREQEYAINLRDENIMVSAGAGAGKTRVLVSRLIGRMLDGHDPVDADRFLVMTFTKAAAAEMKERIAGELSRRLREDPGNRLIRRQMLTVRRADFCTIDSFCSRVVRMHYHTLDIDPSFRIGEKGELYLMGQEVLQEVLEESYRKGGQDFKDFADTYVTGKDDYILEDMIMRMHTFTESLPDARDWFDRQNASSPQEQTARQTEALLQFAKEEILMVRSGLDRLKDCFLPGMDEGPFGDDYRKMCRDAEGLLGAEDYDSYRTLLNGIHFDRIPGYTAKMKKTLGEWPAKDSYKAVRDRMKKVISDQKESLLMADGKELLAENTRLGHLFKEYCRLALDYEDRLLERKKENNVYSFSDIAHLALSLLVDHYDDRGRPVPSKTAEELASRYVEIYVDEYQDVNLIQETILLALSDPEKNSLFTVGDVKQSIYRFRQARPDLFLNRADTGTDLDSYLEEGGTGKGNGVLVTLRDNFRSSPGVIDGINYCFRALMRRDFGGADYDDQTELHAGLTEYGDPGSCEMLFFVKDDESDAVEELPEPVLLEAAMIEDKIRSLREEGYRYGDMAILARSGKDRMEALSDYLEKKGIPVLCESRTGYFETREVSLVMNYLSVVDNACQDIALTSVLLSSMASFTEEDLVHIRLFTEMPDGREPYLYDQLCLYRTSGSREDLREKAGRFLDLLHEFRQEKKEVPLVTLLWDIYLKTGIYYDVLLLPDGKARRENLRMLLHKAEEYEKTIYKGLFYFIRYMRQMKEYDIDMDMGTSSESTEDRVRIMTIHKSKGLEFPVVFLCGMSTGFNFRDASGMVLFHPILGAGLEYLDPVLRIRHAGAGKSLIARQLKKDTVEEELRLLYVAMTRAQERLILTATVNEKKLDSAEDGSGPQAARCFADWILPLAEDACEKNVMTKKLYHWNMIANRFAAEAGEGGISSVEAILSGQADPEDKAAVEKAFSYVYPYREMTEWKRKYSVSELKRLSGIPLPEETPRESLLADIEETEIELPAFLKASDEDETAFRLSGAMRGTLVHQAMELLPFEKIHDRQDLVSALAELTDQWKQIGKLNRSYLEKCAAGFLFSPEGEEIRRLSALGRVYKETPFTIAVPAGEVYEGTDSSEPVIIQGIVDLYCRTEEGLWLIDYKTDMVEPGDEGLLLDRYRKQMLYYEIALSAITGLPVTRIDLYSTSLGHFIPVEL
ncbi:MAG: UvrD-helicase domain-containing protein [Eubacterium sp.]|nr:UvrD-helicase domain-containing protein [Eubacterium sp.]